MVQSDFVHVPWLRYIPIALSKPESAQNDNKIHQYTPKLAPNLKLSFVNNLNNKRYDRNAK